VHEVASVVKVPVIGMGGIESAKDVIEFMSVGATAVEVGSANLVDPYACKKIIEDLPVLLEQIGVKDIKEIIGRTDKCVK
jgi:dihydroorotate dehydrogenase (NAD+) catalytic subunit